MFRFIIRMVTSVNRAFTVAFLVMTVACAATVSSYAATIIAGQAPEKVTISTEETAAAETTETNLSPVIVIETTAAETEVTEVTSEAANEAIEVTEATASEATAHEYSGITMTDEEFHLLEKIVAAESQTQSLEGRKAVVEVIFNRVLSGKFPGTVKGVLSQKGQFSTWRMRNASWICPEYATEAINYVLQNGRTVLPDTGYLYFSRGKSKYATDYIRIEDHWFGRAK